MNLVIICKTKANCHVTCDESSLRIILLIIKVKFSVVFMTDIS